MAPARYILALDQGTSGSTALVVDDEGGVRARGYAEVTQHYPQPGWVEHDPEEIWTTMAAAARQAMAEARVTGREIAAVGITNQRETTIVWERATGAPIHRAIVWQCRRTASLCDRLRADGVEDTMRRTTGLVLDAYFSGTKIRWLLDEIPDARRRAERGELAFGTVDSWLVWKLTGGRVHATDATNASRTLCLDLRAGVWSDEMLAILGVPRAVLPAVAPSSGVFGETADLGWLPRGVPIACSIAMNRPSITRTFGSPLANWTIGCFTPATASSRSFTNSSIAAGDASDTWDVHLFIGNEEASATTGSPSPVPATLTFDATGALTSPTTPVAFSSVFPSGASAPLAITMDFARNSAPLSHETRQLPACRCRRTTL